MKKILFILDPLDQLDAELDTSLTLLREMNKRGYECFIADTQDIYFESSGLLAHCQKVLVRPSYRYDLLTAQSIPCEKFTLVMLRKEPPFDSSYLYLTYLLEQLSGIVPVVNNPRGVRDANEKLCALQFPQLIPNTLVSNQPDKVVAFQEKIGKDLVIKPLHLKGGQGVQLLKINASNNSEVLEIATNQKRDFIVAQEFLRTQNQADKRILLLEGEFLTAYEKRPAQGDFRANLCLGGSFHPTELSELDHVIINSLKSFLAEKGLSFVALDVMEGKLIEINVTCPAGLAEAATLYPGARLPELWADSLERLVAAEHKVQKFEIPAEHNLK